MNALLLPLLLSAAPVAIEALGFSVAVEADAVVVVSVTRGSPAARDGLTARTTIDNVITPQFLFTMGRPLAKLSPTDLHDALTPSHDEKLVFMAHQKGAQRIFQLSRTDARPAQRFSEIPLPPEKVARLSTAEQMAYNAELLATLGARADAARTKTPILAFSGAVEATVDERGVSLVAGGAASPVWIYFARQLSYACPGAPMRSIEVAGPAPVTKVIATSADAHLQGGLVEAQIPLWRVSDAVEACKARRTTLPSVVLTGTLRCEGAAPLTIELSAPLGLTCAPPDKALGPRWDALRVRSAETILTGSSEPTKVAVWWRALQPAPRTATLVELDDAGGVIKRHQTLTPPSNLDEESAADVRLDTSKPRRIRLALELTFPDGSIALGAPQKVALVTPAQNEAELERSFALSKRMVEVQEQLYKAFPKPCAQLDAAVTWLSAQPGVTLATNNDNGHSLSYLVGGRAAILDCHQEVGGY